jgi:hypothetical protein
VATRDEELENVVFNVTQFNDHLGSIYELEMFYGDETLKSLMDHSKQVKNSLEELVLIIEETQDNVVPDQGGISEEKKTA